MKNLYIFIALLIAGATTLISEVALIEEVTIDITDDRTQDAYYDFQDNQAVNVKADNWDISFLNSRTSAISINGGHGVRLWHVTDGSIDDFNAPLDTAGKFEIWEEQFNSTETWDVGAFNLGLNAFDAESEGEFGWGQYSQTVITGTELFVIKLRNGEYKKIAIDELSTGIFYFFYSDLNNENVENVNITKSNFADKLHVAYDLEMGEVVDREPMKEDWHLVFGLYKELIPMGPGEFFPYPVVGIRSNKGVKVAQLDDVEIVDDKFELPSEINFTNMITEIGYDWKTLNGSVYDMVDGRVYIAQKFAKNENQDVVPVSEPVAIRFDNFNGGSFTFKTDAVSLSVKQNEYDNSQFAIYPNVVSKGDNINMIYSGTDMGVANLSVYSSTGGLVISKSVELNKNLQISDINASNMSAGVYFVRIENNSSIYTQKFIVK